MARRDRRSRSKNRVIFAIRQSSNPICSKARQCSLTSGPETSFLWQSNPILKKIIWTRVVRGLEKYCPNRTRVGIWIKRRQVISKNRNCLLEGGKFVISRNFPTSKCCSQLTRIDLFSLVTDFVPNTQHFLLWCNPSVSSYTNQCRVNSSENSSLGRRLGLGDHSCATVGNST